MKENGFRPDWSVSPGEVLAEWMLVNNASLGDISRMTGLSSSVVSDLLGGRQRITCRIATQLSALGHLDADTWMQLQERADGK
jgi:plasmid maintenance system antidote protein VapI